MFRQARRRHWKWLGSLDDRQAFFIDRAISRTILQPVRNQFALTVQHEADHCGTGLAQRTRRKAPVAGQLQNELLVPFGDRISLRITGQRDGYDRAIKLIRRNMEDFRFSIAPDHIHVVVGCKVG
jgi:hypothetical protein